MQIISEQELLSIEGGTSITGTLVNAVSTLIDTIASLGRSFGSSIRRMFSNKMCSL